MHQKSCLNFIFLAVFAFVVTGCKSRQFSEDSMTNQALNFSGQGFKFKSYDVLFTNPVCRDYPYNQKVFSNSGNLLLQKPKNVFCSYDDAEASAARESSPENRLLKWINDPATTKIFFTYLSFSNRNVLQALCDAVTNRNVKIKFVIDTTSDTKSADKLAACKPKNGDPAFAPEYFRRGHTQDGFIGYAHNKIFIVNPGAEDMGIVFSSGNMSAGPVLHHENWHFIRTSAKTYFAQSHLCVLRAEFDDKDSSSAQNYIQSVSKCRKQAIANGAQEESDIKAFFIPGDGDHFEGPAQTGLAGSTLESAILSAEKIDIAAHRFLYWRLKKSLTKVLSRSQGKPDVRIMVDDDTWWAGQGQQVGDNVAEEQKILEDLEALGAQPRYMETNHGAHLLHHNKYLIFRNSNPSNDAVFAGAGNLTGAGFSSNWENYYFIKIPTVVESFKRQYEMIYQMATRHEDLPQNNILPPFENTH